jgi:hypothetical protein
MWPHDNAFSAYGVLKRFDSMLPHIDEAIRITNLMAEGSPDHIFLIYAAAQCRAWRGYALLRTARIEPGLSQLSKAREELESRVGKESSSEAFRRNRVIIVALHALAFAGWSQETSAPLTDRRQRLIQAEMYLAEADEISRTIKSKTGALPAAHTEVAAARAMLRALEER